MMREVDGDELNMMDFTKDILKLVQVAVGLQLSYITNGKLVYVNTDGELLQMWGLLAPSKDGFCRIYADLDLSGVDDFLVMTPRISTPAPNAVSQLSEAEEGDDITLLEIKRGVAKKGKKKPTKVASKPKQVKRKHQKGKKLTSKDMGKSVIIDEEEENFWAELARLKAVGFEDELDDDLDRERVPLVVPANPLAQVGKTIIIDGLQPEEGYHSSHSSEDEREFEIPPELIEYIPHYDLAESTNDLQCVKDLYGNRWAVNLVDHECSCVRWQLSGVVCVHPVRVIYPMRLDWTEYCSSYYWVSTYKQAYMGHIKPMPDPRTGLNQAKGGNILISQASATQVAAPSQAPTTQVAEPSQASTTQMASPSQATKLFASTSTGKNPMIRGKVAATTEASASVTQSKYVDDKELDNQKRLGIYAQPTKPSTVTFGKQAPKSKTFKAPHHRHTFRDFLEKQKMENNKTSKGLIAAASNLTFKPPLPPKRNIQAIGGFGQSMETFKPPPPPLATAVPRQKFKAVKDLGK
ncbi:hypothetical protein IFM89_000546 [Coptis chinensis]|uniref:SWIM-type domain-containing protein n=1 Tax=Coptis chinensis TaxID=261450 RepID=A0A835H0K7_9MAGN|nr:hypothetical protein IFM89_000546 [Coptis chinensis]